MAGRRVRWLQVTAPILGVALLASGCTTDPKAHAQSPAIAAKRAAATASAEATLAQFTPIGRVIGTSSGDWCETGQNNLWWRDTVQFECSLFRAALVAPAQATGPEAATALRAAFTDAECGALAGLPTDPTTDVGGVGVGGPAGANCGSVYVGAKWYIDPFDARRMNNRTHNGSISIELTPFGASAIDQIATTKPMAWWIQADVRYVEEK